MCRRVLATGIALMLIVLTVNIADAQVSWPSPKPFIAVYFDEPGQIEAYPIAPDPCPGVGVLDTLWVYLVNSNQMVNGVQFCIDYPPAITWLSDLWTQPVAVGATPCTSPAGGLSMGYDPRRLGFPDPPDRPYGRIFICGVLVMWNCDDCGNFPDNLIVVRKHTFDGYPEPYPTFTQDQHPYPPIQHYCIGMTSVICPATIATEESTWGKVKALYSD
ncbi:MAG: hypothetical protein JSW58_04510 [Candidatus Latescibacterota bacterium]|nr:MAG: hypothetical protein JSW58_04510 [Candidatus Latescibacterota bacterium]